MKLTVFGNNATCPEANGACSSFLVEVCGKKVLMDMGNGSLTKIRQKIDLATLDAIVISHLHFDHFGDLFCAKYHLETRKAYGEEIPVIPLFAPKLPEWAYADLSTNDVFQIHTATNGCMYQLDDVSLEFVELVHLIESYGIRIHADEKILAYSGDTGICEGLHKVAAEADAFLCESTFCSTQSAEEKHHLSARTAATIAAEAKCKQLLLTHYHSDQRFDIFEEARQFFENVVITEIEKEYAIG